MFQKDGKLKNLPKGWKIKKNLPEGWKNEKSARRMENIKSSRRVENYKILPEDGNNFFQKDRKS